MELNNILINIDVVIEVPQYCSRVNVYIFGIVDSSEIKQTTLQGSVVFKNAGSIPIVGRNIKEKVGDVSSISVHSELEINGIMTNDYTGGLPYND